MSGVQVLAAGPFASVQDLGRPGWAHLGVSGSGAADVGALTRANRLVGNPPGAAAVEAVLGGLRLRTAVDRLTAVTGAATDVVVAGRRVVTDGPVRWPAGTDLILGTPSAGLRSYVGIRGGLDVARVLGSRSTDTLGRIGPGPLRPGDLLPVGPAPSGAAPVAWAVPMPVWGGSDVVLDVGPGPRADRVDTAPLFVVAWTVTADLDRVGVRLVGPGLRHRAAAELPSEGVLRGAVQVPPGGQPVLFGPDHPTTGGYPVVAVLTPASCDRAGQLRAGDVVRFRRARHTATA